MPEKGVQSQFVERDGFRFHYTAHGEGPPLVLLHGGGPGASGLSNYRRNLAALSAHHTLYILDLPGYGQSSKAFDRDNLFYALGESLVSFLDGVGLDKPSFVGNSLGGSAALCLALRHPERVDRLVLMGPGGGFSPLTPAPTAGIMNLMTYYRGPPSIEKMQAVVRNLVFDPASITPELVQERYEASLDPEVVANPPLQPPKPGSTGHMLWRDPGLSTLPHRTLIIWGMEDRTNSPDGAFSFSKVIPNAELYLLPKCGHWAQWEKPDEFHDAVLSFLKRP